MSIIYNIKQQAGTEEWYKQCQQIYSIYIIKPTLMIWVFCNKNRSMFLTFFGKEEKNGRRRDAVLSLEANESA